MTMALQELSFDAPQLGRITRSCRRWMAVESLPVALRHQLEELDSLSQRLLTPASDQEDAKTLLAFVRKNCQSLRSEFAKIQVSFECPSCPLRTG